ncbi:NAD(+) diphosphatase [Roseovarius rhodophyticola]|uniref:NAD(+) diphosphatase n=1 Tax=Roseovarius rhodophyticola TaxID=3080827 RepID=A0ABZ2TI05_9RHOB|nr:NAD(+) diphosphatase [Roseovarius sp. W115]MDV2929508.1 NAD(+) diphosphatase [Roseovarius sp. W115]
MRHAETVTFGGSGLDRCAELRLRPDEIQKLVREGRASAVVQWRGKPLVEAPDLDKLTRLPADHPLMSKDVEGPILLGREEDGRVVLAYELKDWAPDDLDAESLGGFVDQSEQTHPDLPQTQVFAELRRIMTRLSPRDAELAASAKAVLGWHATHRFCARCGSATQITQFGWQRICPDCSGQHFPRTDPVVIMLITHGNRVLMGRSHGWPEGMYSLLAGFIDSGETMEAAVRREVMEEAGIRVGEVGYLASQPWPFPASLMFGCWGQALSEEIRVDPTEIEDAIWVTREDIARAFAGENPDILPARKGAIAHFLLRNWLADTL